MEIVAVECFVLQTPAKDRRSADQTHEAALVRIQSDDGSVGVGEAASTPAVVKAFIEEPTSFFWSQGVRDILLGQDPRDPRTLWQRLYEGTFWSGRTGLGHIALAGVDMALWDLAGNIAQQPVWQLLGSTEPKPAVPYLTMYSGPSQVAETIENTVALLDRALAEGYRAAKIEAPIETAADNDEIVELVRAVREHAGPDVTLALDVGYRWKTAAEALDCTRRLEDFDLAFIESPFMPDCVEDYRELAAACPTPLAGAEILTAHAEYLPLLDAGVQVIQAGTCRIGITECDRLVRSARARGRRFVPYGYVSTIFSTAANLHVATAHDNVPLVEHAPATFYPHMVLRNELGGPEPVMRDGMFEIPSAPGLGVTLDDVALDRYQVR